MVLDSYLADRLRGFMYIALVSCSKKLAEISNPEYDYRDMCYYG